MKEKTTKFIGGLTLYAMGVCSGVIGVGLYKVLWNENNQPYKSDINQPSNKVNMDVTGYTVENDSIKYQFLSGSNKVSVKDSEYRINDGGLYGELDGKVDVIYGMGTGSIARRKNLSEKTATEFDELLAKYKKDLDITKIHTRWLVEYGRIPKGWEEKYKK